MSKEAYGLLGKNIQYSLSPIMHNAAFEYYDISAEYKLFDEEFILSGEDIYSDFTNLVMGNDIKGLNVTVPYKVAVHDMIKAREECKLTFEAERLGAVNTLKIDGSSFTGFNTDSFLFFSHFSKRCFLHCRYTSRQ